MKNSTILTKKNLYKIIAICFWIAVWQLVYMYVKKEILIVSPFSVLKNILMFMGDKTFWITILYSFLRIVTGLILGILVGTVIAFINYFFKWTYYLFSPLFTIIKVTPVVSFILLLLVWVKSNNIPIIISFLMAVPIIWNNVYTGISNVDKKFLDVSKLYKYSKKDVIKYIYTPTIIPFFIAALKLCLGLTWKSGIAAEVICILSNSIGGKIYEAKIYIETLDLFSWTIVIIIISIIFEKVFIKILDKVLEKGRLKL